MTINELALFAGAGGGLLASHLFGFRTICAVEYDEGARRILVSRQNDGTLRPFPIWDDVRTFDGQEWRGFVDLVSGGFPCQAYSTAASGRNVADDLWPEMRRVVADVVARYVFAENVSKRAIDAAADDLEQMGYKTRCISFAASDMGADHIRARHWLLAYADNPRELLRALNDETSIVPTLQTSVWQQQPASPNVADGVAGRLDGIKATGNGQVPAVAAAALMELVNA